MTDLPREVNITMSISFLPPAQNVFVLYKESCSGPGSILTKMFCGLSGDVLQLYWESPGPDLHCQMKASTIVQYLPLIFTVWSFAIFWKTSFSYFT